MVDENKDPIQAAIENNPCGSCRAMGLPGCKGHGRSGGGSSGGGGSDNGETKNKEFAYASNRVTSAVDQITNSYMSELDKSKATWMQSQLFSDRMINYEAGLLSIESDRLRGDLTFRVKPGLSKDEIEISREFLKMVKTEFDTFKNQLAEQGVSTNNFTVVLKDNDLAIHIPNPKYFNEFIKHLDSKNLLPVPNATQQDKRFELDKEEVSQQNKKPSYLNPFPTQPVKK